MGVIEKDALLLHIMGTNVKSSFQQSQGERLADTLTILIKNMVRIIIISHLRMCSS